MNKRHYIIPIFVPHLGCPHDCVFCNQRKIATSEENMDEVKAISIIEEHLSTINPDNSTIEVSFFGGTFTAIPMEKQKELLAVAARYKDAGKIDYIRMSTRPDYIDEDILNHLKKFKVDIIELGVQSLDEIVLFASGRGHKKEDVYKASKLIKEFGFILGHQIMLGLPGDNRKKDIETAIESLSLSPDICRIYPALVIKNTPMEVMYKRGIYKPYSLEEAVDICKDIYSLYSSKGVAVIRIGLQATDNINVNGDIVDGPFHPSFRELVESSLIKDMLLYNLKNKTGDYELRINNRYISRLYANKKNYFNELKNEIKEITLKVKIDNEVPIGEIFLDCKGSTLRLSLKDYTDFVANKLIRNIVPLKSNPMNKILH
ncbi:elongator complex protein 3 [Alloiococcus sp. CFN-8]|uniref:elongator complex protein 3 n=1 Tax=Alloiococcus sp. CFN-8 TaxID=3416081 RepID=UPI003CEE4349